MRWLWDKFIDKITIRDLPAAEAKWDAFCDKYGEAIGGTIFLIVLGITLRYFGIY